MFNFLKKALSGPEMTSQLGVPGILISSGNVYDDFLRELQGQRGREKYKEMKENDPTVGAIISAITRVMKTATWRVDPAKDDVGGEYAEWLEENTIKNLKGGWHNFIGEFDVVLVFGFGIYEMVFRRNDDGSFGLDQLAPRSQETIWEFDVTEHGELLGVWQWPKDGWRKIYLPRHKFLHVRTQSNRGNPEGRSIFRNAYRSYCYIKALEQVEAIGVERDLAGLPVLYVPSKCMETPALADSYTKIVRDLKFNEQGGVVLPSDLFIDGDGKKTGQKQFHLELLSSNSSRNNSAGEVIRRHQSNIAMSALADFLLLGQGKTGSYALAETKSSLFMNSVHSFMMGLASDINEQVVGALWKVNGFPDDMKPTITYDDIAPTDLQELGDYVARLSGAGIMLGDEDTANKLRDAAGLPPQPLDDDPLLGVDDGIIED